MFPSTPKPELAPMSIWVDCDLDPRIPSGLYLTGEGTEHHKMGTILLEKRTDGKLYANGREVVRYLSPNQQGSRTMRGHKLRKELKDKQVLNACILDALLMNPQLVPDEWKIGVTHFWGSIFRDASGYLYVRCVSWGGEEWDWYYDHLGCEWDSFDPVALVG